MGLEPTKIGFADRRLDRFGIATKLFAKVLQTHTQNCTQIALLAPIYPVQGPRNLLKPRAKLVFGEFCRLMPYHLATAPSVVLRRRLTPTASDCNRDCSKIKKPPARIWRWGRYYKPAEFEVLAVQPSHAKGHANTRLRATTGVRGLEWLAEHRSSLQGEAAGAKRKIRIVSIRFIG